MSEASDRRYAGFWIRLAAHVIDSLLLDAAALASACIVYGAIYWVQVLTHSRSGGGFFEAVNGAVFQIVWVSVGTLLSLPYYIWGQARYGTTIGKYPFGIEVVDFKTGKRMSLRQSAIRCLGYVLSYLPFCAGFLMAGFQPEKRALHDLLAGTVSIRRKRKT